MLDRYVHALDVSYADAAGRLREMLSADRKGTV